MIKIDGKKTLAFLLAITFVISVTSAIVGAAADNTSGNRTANNKSGTATSGQVTIAKGAPGTGGAANNKSGTATSGQVTGTGGSSNCKGSQPTCDKQFKAICDKGKWKCAFVGRV